MQVKIQTFPVGSGDCISLLLKNGDKEIKRIFKDRSYYFESF